MELEDEIERNHDEFNDERIQLQVENEESKLFLEGELERTVEQCRTLEVRLFSY